MFDSILIPLDGSPLSATILASVSRILRREDFRVVLLRVVEPGAVFSHEQEKLVEFARSYLEEIAEPLRAEGATIETKAVIGDPAEVILSQVEATSPSLVAMATHGRRGLQRWVRGSVAERVLRRCPVPLLLVNPDARDEPGGFERILVPLDGSELSASILPLAEAVAGLYDSEITLLQVGAEPFAAGVYPEGMVVVQTPSREELLESLKPRVDQLCKAGINARAWVMMGDPAAVILEVAKEKKPDLLLMTTHGHSGLDRWLFGSVAEKVLRAVTCPVLVRRVASFQTPKGLVASTAEGEHEG